jgi:hypothetical protein
MSVQTKKTMNDCYQLAETGRVHWTAAHGHSEVNRYASRLLDNDSSRTISGTNLERPLAHVAGTMANLVTTDAREHIPAIYHDFLKAFSKAKAETL